MTLPAANVVPESKLRLAFELAPTGMVLVNAAGAIVLANAQMERLFGYSRVELIGLPFEQLIPQRVRNAHPEYSQSFFAAPRTLLTGQDGNLLALTRSGAEIPVESGMTPLDSHGGDVLVTIVDIGRHHSHEEQLRQRTADLSKSLKERDVLLQEVHHRAKNTLQVISSLISLQARKLGDGESSKALNECKARVEAIGLIHSKLYESRDVGRVPFSDYVRSLAHKLIHANNSAVRATFETDNVALAIDKAIPCGLILNELISEAIAKASAEGQEGNLWIELRRIDSERVRLTVRDDRVIDSPAPVEGARSLGMQLVRTLTDQLEGTLTTTVDHGTAMRVEFAAAE